MKSLITMFSFCASMVILVVAPDPSFKCNAKFDHNKECNYHAKSGTELFLHQLDEHNGESVCYYLCIYADAEPE